MPDNFPVAFLYKPDTWPPKALIDGPEPFRRRKDYPLTDYRFFDFLGARWLWVNVWTSEAVWTTGECVWWHNDWENDTYLEDFAYKRGYSSPSGPFLTIGERVVVENWVLMTKPDEFFALKEKLDSEKAAKKFMDGDDTVLKQTTLF